MSAGGRTPSIEVSGISAKIFVAELLPLDPVVTAISPGHDAKEVSAVEPIVVRFSKSMDKVMQAGVLDGSENGRGIFLVGCVRCADIYAGRAGISAANNGECEDRGHRA